MSCAAPPEGQDSHHHPAPIAQCPSTADGSDGSERHTVNLTLGMHRYKFFETIAMLIPYF